MNFSGSRIRHFLGRLNWRWVHLPAVFVLVALSLHVWNNPRNLEVSITATLPPGVKTTLYYTKGHRLFKDSQSIQHINKQFRESTQTYTVRTWATVRQLRWDPMEYEGRLSLQRVDISNQISHWTLQAPQIGHSTHNNHLIEWVGHDETGERLISTGQDPHMEWHLPASLHHIPKDIWIRHALKTLLASALLTWCWFLTVLWLANRTQRNGKRWLVGFIGQALGFACLAYSAQQLIVQHDWWSLDVVRQANERDGIRHALPPVIQDAKVLLQRIDPNTPVSLSPRWKANYMLYYGAEEYLYPRRFSELAPLRLSEKGSEVDPQCQPLHEHGAAVLLQCHD